MVYAEKIPRQRANSRAHVPERNVHPVTLDECRNPFPDFFDHTSSVASSDCRILLDEDTVLLDFPVDGIQPSGDHFDEDLPGSGFGDWLGAYGILAFLGLDEESFLLSAGHDWLERWIVMSLGVLELDVIYD